MPGIKETPTNFRVYYTCMRDAYTQKKEEATAILEDLCKQRDDLYIDVKSEYNLKGKDYGITLEKYKEFVENRYITGELFRVAKGYLINKEGNYEIIGSRFNLYKLAEIQKEIYKLEQDIIFSNKMLNITLKEYTNILKMYYNEVHKKMIIDGYGYAIGGRIGWTCFNRCHIVKAKPHIDYAATKKNKERLLAEGKRLYDKEEAEWCRKNGIEYDGVDGRVYRNPEYVYEMPLINCTLPDGSKMKLTTSNYYGRSVRGKSNQQLIEECNYDKNKICELDLDVRAKLDLCLEIDKILYTKFIRNENQKPSNDTTVNR